MRTQGNNLIFNVCIIIISGYLVLSSIIGCATQDHHPTASSASIDSLNGDLWNASQRGHVELVRALIQKGVSVESKDAMGNTALMFASQGGHADVVDILLKNGANTNTRSRIGATALMYACQYGHERVLRLLIAAGADVNLEHHKGGSTLLMIAAHKGHSDTIKILLRHGAEVNVENDEGRTALMLAAGTGHIGIVKSLLCAGADIRPKDKYGKTAIYYAQDGGFKDIANLLKKATSSKSSRSKGVPASQNAEFLKAAGEGDLKGLKPLLDNGINVDVRDKDSEIQLAITPDGKTMFVGPGGKLDMGGITITPPPGSRLVPVHIGGNTALIIASENGHLEAVKYLLEKGADINARNNANATALMAACLNGHKKVVELLLKKGANVNIRPRSGRTALRLANEKGHKEIVDLLKVNGAIE